MTHHHKNKEGSFIKDTDSNNGDYMIVDQFGIEFYHLMHHKDEDSLNKCIEHYHK